MINIYDFICSNASYFDQLKFGNDEKIFIDYLCPITEDKARAWSHKNCLMYVVQGSKGYAPANYYHLSQEHQFLFVRKGGIILHQDFKTPYRALIFMFDDSSIKEFFGEYPELLVHGGNDFIESPAISELPSSIFIRSVFISSLDYLKSPAVENSISLELKFKELLVNVMREKDANSFRGYLSQICNNEAASFIKLMRENSQYNFTSKELARIACMSLSTFKRVFIKHFGIPPGKWLHEQRIARAIALLAHDSNSVSEIAFELGYSDAAAFSKAFKLATKLSPVEYCRNRSIEPK